MNNGAKLIVVGATCIGRHRLYTRTVSQFMAQGTSSNVEGGLLRLQLDAPSQFETLLSMSTIKNIHVEPDPEWLRPIDIDLQVSNIAKFKAVTGWEPEIPFEQTMHDLLHYWRDRIQSRYRFLT